MPYLIMKVPKELWRLVDLLMQDKNCFKDPSLFFFPGDTHEILVLQEQLDKGGLSFISRFYLFYSALLICGFQKIDFISNLYSAGEEITLVSTHSIADAILCFINSLPKPIISDELLPTEAIDSQNMRQWSRQFLSSLPGLEHNLFLYLLSLFRDIFKFREFNVNATPEKLGSILTIVLTACIDTSTRESSVVNPATDIEVLHLFGRDKRYSHMSNVMAYFLTSITF